MLALQGRFNSIDIIISILSNMGKGRPQKYNRVSCHQKFMLRRFILIEKKSVKHAADQLGINYSTAKTIMFFHRKPFDTSPTLSTTVYEKPQASVTASFTHSSRPKKVEIISSIGRKSWNQSNQQQHEAMSSCKIQSSS